MSGKGKAVGAAVGVAEGDGVCEGDAFCACAPDAKHRNSRPTASNAARRARVIILSAEIRERRVDCGIIGPSGISPVRGDRMECKYPGDGVISKSLGTQSSL